MCILFNEKDWVLSNKIELSILYDTLSTCCISKAIVMKSEDVIYQKVYVSPQPPPTISYKDNWMKELLDSEVAGSRKDTQRIQPKPKTQLLRTVRPVGGQESTQAGALLLMTCSDDWSRAPMSNSLPRKSKQTRFLVNTAVRLALDAKASLTWSKGCARWTRQRQSLPSLASPLMTPPQGRPCPKAFIIYVPPSTGGRTTQAPFTTSVRLRRGGKETLWCLSCCHKASTGLCKLRKGSSEIRTGWPRSGEVDGFLGTCVCGFSTRKAWC